MILHENQKKETIGGIEMAVAPRAPLTPVNVLLQLVKQALLSVGCD
jgi:hypothetical protein